MSELAIENTGFSKIVDTVYDSKLLAGLAQIGVLPPTFRVIKGTLDLAGKAFQTNGYPLLDVNTNQQIKLNEGTAIIYRVVYATSTITSGGSATVNVNVATTSGGVAAGTQLFRTGAGAGAIPIANITSSGLPGATVDAAASAATQPLDNAVFSNSADGFVQVNIGTANITSGAVAVLLVVV